LAVTEWHLKQPLFFISASAAAVSTAACELPIQSAATAAVIAISLSFMVLPWLVLLLAAIEPDAGLAVFEQDQP
jgi:hypothetical protein